MATQAGAILLGRSRSGTRRVQCAEWLDHQNPASNVAINRFALPNNTSFVGQNRVPTLFILQVSQQQIVTSMQNDRMFQHSEFSFRLADQVLLTYLAANNPHPLVGVKAQSNQ
jgi:hypothetical protein